MANQARRYGIMANQSADSAGNSASKPWLIYINTAALLTDSMQDFGAGDPQAGDLEAGWYKAESMEEAEMGLALRILSGWERGHLTPPRDGAVALYSVRS